MKSVFYLLILFTCIACNSSKVPGKICCTILLDYTDTLAEVSNLTAEQIILNLGGKESLLTNGVELRFCPITAYRLNKESVISLAPAPIGFFENNEVTRKNEVDTFIMKVSTFLKEMKISKRCIGNSAIFEEISKQSDLLTECPDCTITNLIIFSDLRQNSTVLNSYASGSIESILRNPDSVIKVLDNKCPVHSSLKGILITLVHEPENTTDDAAYSAMSALTVSWLKRHKAEKIRISSTLSQ